MLAHACQQLQKAPQSRCLLVRDCMQESMGLARCCTGGDEEGYGAYYRSERTRALDEHFGDMLHKIHDLEARSLASFP